MEQYIKKSALLAEIDERIKVLQRHPHDNHKTICHLDSLKQYLNTLEVKEVQEYEQPDYSCFETTYKCGKKPHWSIGDTLAYYESCSDREGECVLGKITKVEFDEEQCDWLYTFEDGSVYDEQSLLEDETYKKK